MPHALFFVAAVAAGLSWTAMLVAAAARVHRGWLRRLLIATGELLPIVAWLPWLGITALLAFGISGPTLATNWFPQVCSVFLSTAVGAIWIGIAGLRTNRATGAPNARRWPIGTLVAAFVAAKLAAGGLVLSLDQAMTTRAHFLRIEAAQLIDNNLPPRVSDAENAAPLYVAASALLDADPDFGAVEQLLTEDEPGLLERPEVIAALARHRDTLALLERAAARDVCRFARDWTRPSFAMLLPEIQAMRRSARLVALAARSDAAHGDAAAAVKKVEMIGAFAQHAASEPLVITMLVGMALDAVAGDTLAHVLPSVTADDADLLESLELPSTKHAMPRALLGEEAFGLSSFADVIEGGNDGVSLLDNGTGGPSLTPLFVGRNSPIGMLFRVFLMPADLAGYRRLMHAHQRLAAGGSPYPRLRTQSEEVLDELRRSPPGVLSALVVPALTNVLEAGIRDEARHAATTILIAATRQRLATGSLPATLEDLDSQWLPLPPGDPFTGTTFTDRAPLRYRLDDAGLTVWSIGPDGEDDGGPQQPSPDSPRDHTNDDIGLTMPLARDAK